MGRGHRATDIAYVYILGGWGPNSTKICMTQVYMTLE